MSVDAPCKHYGLFYGGYRGEGSRQTFSKTVRLKVFIIEAKITELKLGLTFIYLEICRICSNRLSRRIFFYHRSGTGLL